MRNSLRQEHRKRASAARRIFYGNFSVVCVDDLRGNTESQTEMAFFGTGLFHAVKTFKNMFFFSVGNAGAVVRNGKRCAFSVGRKGELYASARGGVTEGILQKDGEHLNHTLFVAGYGRDGRLRQRDGERDILFGRNGFKSFVEI